MSPSRFPMVILLVGILALNVDVVFGQNYPSRPVRIITAAAGGGGDFTARQIAQGISGPLGQPVIVDNRALGVLASEAVSKASPDGYTLLVGGASVWLLPLLQKVPYDVADLMPISLTDRTVNIVALHPSVPAHSIKDLIVLAKARPGELNYSSGGIGTPAHLSAELFKSMAGVNIVNVAYKGSAPAITALIGGEVQLTIYDAGLVLTHVKTGRLRALAVTSAEPSALTPGLPTVAASGLPGYESVGMTGVFAPAKVPATIINRLNQEMVRVLNVVDVKERFLNAGIEVVASSSDQFAATIKSDSARTGKVIKDAGIKAD